MATIGMIVNDSDTALTAGSWASTLMHEDTSEEAASLHGALPSSGFISTLDLVIQDAAGAPTVTTIELFGTWDSAGDEIFLPYTKLTVNTDTVPGQTTGTRIMASVKYERCFTQPSVQTTAGKMYLWIKLTDEDGDLRSARLNWYVPTLRG